ncbi:unnamed protein product [Ambrosiozyma monospora]|uniref:Unnamed protein product n=1 Tax=Ambrosiozyma monospora TaxID=43982 RepID=A0A9W7DDL5_AMBMO|nr:unnamed protein product [Ambrosiozyma monospora]
MVITDEDLANLDVDNDALLDLMTADKETTDFIKKVVILAAEEQERKCDDYVNDTERQAVKEDENLKKSLDRLHLLINMKDLQNLTTDFIKFLALIEDKVEESCTFKDEKKTTRLFYALSAVIVFLWVIGPYIPWKFIFVVGMWLALLMIHPKRQECFDSLSKYSLQKYEQYSTQIYHDFHRIKRKLSSSEHRKEKLREELRWRNTRAADLKKLESVDQIFQIQGRLGTEFHDFGFSLSTFVPTSQLRQQGRDPEFAPGFDLDHPPRSIWRWFYSYKWEIDENTLAWTVEQSNGENLLVKDDETWVYDRSAVVRRRRYVKKISRTHFQRLVTKVIFSVGFLFAITLSVFVLSRYLSFVELLWCGLPLIVLFRDSEESKYLLKLIKSKFNFFESNNKHPVATKDNIIIEEETPRKKVHIFEIQKQKHKPVGYYPLGFSTSPYAPSSPRRKQKKKPETTGDLTTVRPPSSHWRFFDESQWEVDQNYTEWWCFELDFRYHEIDLGFAGDAQGGWVYDKDGAYRRRRLTRMVKRSDRRRSSH